MNPFAILSLTRFALYALLLATGISGEGAEIDSPRKLDSRLNKFFSAKEQHARALVKDLKLPVAPEVWPFFEAGKKGDWSVMAGLYREMRRRSGQYAGTTSDAVVHTPVWQTVNETYSAYEGFAGMDGKFVDAFGQGIIDLIPRGSIYFGGTDPGRWLITALSKSHADGNPFFTLTQNALADGTYLAYLRAMYGKRIAIPTDEDGKKAYEAYLAEAGPRLEKGELNPGENISKDADGNYSVSGTVSVMAVNGRIARTLFEGNPEREFYLEQSHALDWMYPHLAPHGLIFKLHRIPLAEVTEAMVKKDQDFWRRQTTRWLGDWLTETTSVKTVCDFAERVYAEANLDDFKGDRDYVLGDRRYSPQGIYARLRAAHASLYAWRATQTSDPEDKARMIRAADLAYRQAFALGPWAHEAAFGYADFLEELKREGEVQLLLDTAAHTNSGDKQLFQRAEEWREK